VTIAQGRRGLHPLDLVALTLEGIIVIRPLSAGVRVGSISDGHRDDGLFSSRPMAEVHLTIHDRRLIAQTFEGDINYPPNIKRGTWYRLKHGNLDFIDLEVWVELWDIFPLILKIQLKNGKPTAPTTSDEAYKIRSSRNISSHELPDHDRRPWEFDDW
jgi:hypothetical protein